MIEVFALILLVVVVTIALWNEGNKWKNFLLATAIGFSVATLRVAAYNDGYLEGSRDVTCAFVDAMEDRLSSDYEKPEYCK